MDSIYSFLELEFNLQIFQVSDNSQKRSATTLAPDTKKQGSLVSKERA